mmetsp:Transcript_29542/g.81203  ORF Transcript_29542/g.81203 Transcript_29542/m.81203 type:complete len:397 (-) Transcript_29542:1251-2441(-)
MLPVQNGCRRCSIFCFILATRVVMIAAFLLCPIDDCNVMVNVFCNRVQIEAHRTQLTINNSHRKDEDVNEAMPQRDRRFVLSSSFFLLSSLGIVSENPFFAYAAYSSESIERRESLDPRAIVTVRLESVANDSLGLELGTTTLRGQSIVFIKSIVKATQKNKFLRPGMILLDFDTAQDAVTSIQQWQQSDDPSASMVLKFYNLAAGGDAFNDVGETIVTAQDALALAKRTDSSGGGIVLFGEDSRSQQPSQQQPPQSYIFKTTKTANGSCGIKTRRGDVLEMLYDAYYYTADDPKPVLYDSSSFRGTGRPYQMVLGSGDMLPGVDLSLAEMCPGEIREVLIPPSLGYGAKGNKLYSIPPNATLKWTMTLSSIDGTITETNNIQTRSERDESRSLYQ